MRNGASNHQADFIFREISAWQAGWKESRRISLAIRGQHIIRAGAWKDMADLTGLKTEILEYADALLLPGFCDAHMHPLMGGQALLECDLSKAADGDDCLKSVADYVQANPQRNIITGGGWHDGDFKAPGPRREVLDAIEKERPVLLYSIDRHSLWLNSKALQLAGITAQSENPAGGIIERLEDGRPSGTLREWTAMSLAEKIIPKPSQAELEAYAGACSKLCAKTGLTSLHDAMADEKSLKAYQTLLEQGKIMPHISASILWQPEDGPSLLEKAAHMRAKYRHNALRAGSIKFFLDGVTEGRTAWLSAPYNDKPGYCGDPLWEEKPFLEAVRQANRAGFQIHIHCIGDAAIDLAIQAIETAVKDLSRPEFRPQLAHLDMVRPEQIAAIKRLGITANVQPAWFYKDKVFESSLLPGLGPERSEGLYPLRDLLRAGIKTAYSSDWPASGDFMSLNPLDGIQIGATRRGPQGHGPAWNPEQIVSAPELAAGYTAGGAWSMFREEQAGLLKEGMEADLVVLDRDIFNMDKMEISKAKALLTMRKGKLAWRK